MIKVTLRLINFYFYRLHEERHSLSQEVERLQKSLNESESEREQISKLEPSPNPPTENIQAENEDLQRQVSLARAKSILKFIVGMFFVFIVIFIVYTLS